MTVLAVDKDIDLISSITGQPVRGLMWRAREGRFCAVAGTMRS